MAKRTLYQIKEDLATLAAQMRSEADAIAASAADPAVPLEDLQAKKKRLAGIRERYDALKEIHDRQEEQERAGMAAGAAGAEGGSAGEPGATDPKAKARARGQFFAAVLQGKSNRDAIKNLANQLGAIPPDDSTGGGANLLPTQMGSELITEPFAQNPMREIVTVSEVVGLELPKMAFTIDDDAFVTDLETARELAQEGDKVTFGRFKSKIVCEISDTVMRGTPVALDSYVSNALQSGLAAKEKRCMFNRTPPAKEAHMSLYSAANKIKRIGGASLIEAIINALGDLPDEFAAMAKVVMRRADYLKEIRTLANDNATLWGAPPQDVIGVPVVFCDAAVQPVVGAFSYAQINYDGPSTYDAAKDVKSGMHQFVLTAWLDIQYKLRSAFRIVDLDSDNYGGEEDSLTVKTVAALPTSGQLEGVVYVLTADDAAAGSEYTAGSMWMWEGSVWIQYNV